MKFLSSMMWASPENASKGKSLKTAARKILQFLLMAGLLLTAAVSFAQATERHVILQKMEADGAKVGFLGHAYGLDGWIVADPEGSVSYVYTTAEGGLMSGMLFAPDGSLETMKQLKDYNGRAAFGTQAAMAGAEKSSSKSEKLYAEVEKANWAALGESTAPYLYVFINAGCDHCQEFWKGLEASVKAGSLQVRLVPYGSLELNRDGAAALLSAEHPEEAWRAYVGGDKAALGKDKIKDGAYLKVDENTALTKNWKLPGPPFTLYRRPADGVVTAIAGQPENTMLLLAEMLK